MTTKGPIFYVAKEAVEQSRLKEAIEREAKARSTTLVALRMDQSSSISLQQKIIDLTRRLGYRLKVAQQTSDDGQN